MSRTTITLKFKLRWFPDEPNYWAEKWQTVINLPPPMPDEVNSFDDPLVLDLSKCWRRVKTKGPNLSGEWHEGYNVLAENRTKCTRPGLEPGPLDSQASALTIRRSRYHECFGWQPGPLFCPSTDASVWFLALTTLSHFRIFSWSHRDGCKGD